MRVGEYLAGWEHVVLPVGGRGWGQMVGGRVFAASDGLCETRYCHAKLRLLADCSHQRG